MTDKGGVEIKLIDRVRALEALCGLLGETSAEGAGELYRVLAEAADDEGDGRTAEIAHFSPKQRKVLTWWCRRSGWEAIICDGAVRSGKTFSMGLSFFLWAQACFDGRQFGLCGKTIVSLRRNLLTELVPYLQRLGFDCRRRGRRIC